MTTIDAPELTYRQLVNQKKRELAAGIDRLEVPDAKPRMSKEAAIKKADRLMREATASVAGIVAGQPILSTRDRNRRSGAWDKIRQANDLLKEHGL